MTRLPSKPRPAQGAHLLALRKAAGLNQTELGDLIGENQQTIAYWELNDRPPRSDALPKLAKVLGVSVEEIISPDGPAPRKSGPVGRAQRILDEVSKLPRRQQDKIIDVVAALLDQYRRGAPN